MKRRFHSGGIPGRKTPWYAWLALLFPLALTAAVALAVPLLFPPGTGDVAITDPARYLEVNDYVEDALASERFRGVLPEKTALSGEGVTANYRYRFCPRDRIEFPTALIRLELTFDGEAAYWAEAARTALEGARDERDGDVLLRLFDAETACRWIAEKLDRDHRLDGCAFDLAWAVFDDGARRVSYTLACLTDVDSALDAEILEDLRRVAALTGR